MGDAALIRVGVIASAHGVRGQVKIRCFTENPDDLMQYAVLTDKAGRKFYLTRHGVKEKSLIASIEGINDRNAAELLRGTDLYAPAPAIEENTDAWHYDELVGLEARLIDGKAYGKVIGIFDFGAGDIVEIELPDGKTEMLPFSKKFVGDVRPQDGYMVVFPPNYVEPTSEL